MLFLILGIVTDHTLGREVVTVNVNQINEDLIRQVGAVSNTVNPPASHSYLQGDIYFLYGHVHKRNYQQPPQKSQNSDFSVIKT